VTTKTDLELPVWAQRTDSVLQQLSADPAHGLSDSEILERRRAWGRNMLQATKRRSVTSIFLAQFRSLVIVLLIVAGVLALVFSDIAEGVAIFAVVLINSGFGFLTEWRAIRSMEALHQIARVDCVVLRNGAVEQVPAETLVPGDIVLLDAGDLVPADLRLIEVAKLTADESTLTGESLPVHKHTRTMAAAKAIFERHNMAFKGTVITRGSARGVVTGTGLNTEFGKIFEQVSEAEAHRTPLEKRLDALGQRLAWGVIVIAAVIAVAGIGAGRETFLAIEVAIALAVAAIPEGLPIVATMALARGMWRMARRNALITRLSAVETLGATNVILTDKTGTLTENRMAATRILLEQMDITVDATPAEESARFHLDGDPIDAQTASLLDELLSTAVLCNNASLQEMNNGELKGVGDPTEVALLVVASGRGIRRESELEQAPEIREDAFDPDLKRMATVHKGDGDFMIAVKGAPEAIISRCVTVRTVAGKRPLDDESRQQWLARVERLAASGLRTMAIACKRVATADADPYPDLILIGVVGLEDPAREGVDKALSRCHGAGVSVVMVTGDHAATARNIATAIGIVDAGAEPAQFIDGEDVDRCLAEARRNELLAARVFSRVTPEQKLKLIELYQENGDVVAMTGDGVNDAPALKKADIGIAMGIRGTAVAKEAADMILQDDEFETIVAAITHGRVIFENIRKFVVYLLSCNTSEVLVVSIATVAGAPLPLLPLQILFLNLVTDVFPALALGVGSGSRSMMKDKPRAGDEQILMQTHWLQIGLHGSVMALTVLAAMSIAGWYMEFDRERTVTVAFCTLALAQMWHVFNMRSNVGHIVNNDITRNVWIWLALTICLALVLAAVYAPGLKDVLVLSDPGQRGWAIIFVASIVPLLTAPIIRRMAGHYAQHGSETG
jgi:Ca2+-transporting ATPase